MKRIVVKGKEVVLKVLHRPDYLDGLIRHFDDLIYSNTECKQFLHECENDLVDKKKCQKHLQLKYHPDKGASLKKSQAINQCSVNEWMETDKHNVMQEFTETIRDIISKLRKVKKDAERLINEVQMSRKPNQVIQVLETKLTQLRDNLRSVANSSRAEEKISDHSTSLAEEEVLESDTSSFPQNQTTALSTNFKLQLLVSESETHFSKIIRDMMHDLTTLRVILKFFKEAESDEELMRLKEAIKSMFGRQSVSLERAEEGLMTQNNLIDHLLYFVP
jgi:vacuolar-type H+-ATPase subunit I/STV1